MGVSKNSHSKFSQYCCQIYAIVSIFLSRFRQPGVTKMPQTPFDVETKPFT